MGRDRLIHESQLYHQTRDVDESELKLTQLSQRSFEACPDCLIDP
jgi:hypothetical protein